MKATPAVSPRANHLRGSGEHLNFPRRSASRMAEFRFSRVAEADLLSIGAYTLRTWGEDQTIRYIEDLEACCQTLADNPTLGRACDEVRDRKSTRLNSSHLGISHAVF